MKNFSHILITHHHYDHVGGVKKLKEKYSCEIVASKKDLHRINNVDTAVSDGDIVDLGFSEFLVIDTPGHTSGHISFYEDKNSILFCGDTMFSLGCGRLFEGSYEEMWASLKRLSSLKKETKVYCTHEYTLANIAFVESLKCDLEGLADFKDSALEKRSRSIPTIPSNLETELRLNPFLNCDNKYFLKQLGLDNIEASKVFQCLRVRKDNF